MRNGPLVLSQTSSLRRIRVGHGIPVTEDFILLPSASPQTFISLGDLLVNSWLSVICGGHCPNYVFVAQLGTCNPGACLTSPTVGLIVTPDKLDSSDLFFSQSFLIWDSILQGLKLETSMVHESSFILSRLVQQQGLFAQSTESCGLCSWFFHCCPLVWVAPHWSSCSALCAPA